MASEIKKIKSDLLAKRIKWYPRKHHTGSFLVIKKLYDFLSISLLMVGLRLFGVKVLWSFANVASAIAWPYSKLLGFKMIIYSYEPHSDFMAELFLWKRNSIKYRLLKHLETRAGLDADYVLTGTNYMVKELTDQGASGKIFRSPTGVDEEEFYFRMDGRKTVERRFGLSSSDPIILYMGKFGDLYYSWQIPFFFRIIKKNIPNVRFIVITPTSYSCVSSYFEKGGLDIGDVICLFKPPQEDIKLYISAANLGISAIPPTPSQRFRSPTKVGEYLLCGLPYLTCKGVSEDDIVALKEGVGVVVNDFSEESITKSIPSIKEYLSMDREEIARKCRQIGLKYRAKGNVDIILKHIFEELA
jgi:hypothetical protein